MNDLADRPMSPLGAQLMSLGQSLHNVSKEAYAQGVAEGERKAKAKRTALEAALEDARAELEHSLEEPSSVQSIRKTIAHIDAALRAAK